LALPASSATTLATDAAELIRRAQAGDTGAFEAIYRQNVDRVYALCLRMVHDREQAEELTQDVFVRCWEALDSFRGESAFSTWLHRLAVNVVLQAARSEKRRLGRVELTDDPAAIATPQPKPEPGVRMDLEAAIATLPPGARQVFLLHDVEGYKHAEISEVTGSAVGTLKAQLHRARRLLREALER